MVYKLYYTQFDRLKKAACKPLAYITLVSVIGLALGSTAQRRQPQENAVMHVFSKAQSFAFNEQKQNQQAVRLLYYVLKHVGADEQLRFLALIELGDRYRSLYQLDSAQHYYSIAYQHRKENAVCLQRLGRSHYEKGKYTVALEYESKALSQATQQKDSALLSKIYHDLALINWSTGKPENTIYYANRVIEIEQQKSKSEILGRAYVLLASIYSQGRGWGNNGKTDFKKALAYMYKAYEADLKVGEVSNIAYDAVNIANTYSQLREYDKADEYYQKAGMFFQKLNNSFDWYSYHGSYGTFLCYSGRQQYEQGVQMIKQAINGYQQVQYKSYEAMMWDNLAKVYTQHALITAYQLKDQLSTGKVHKEIQELNFKYETARKDALLANQERALLSAAERNKRYWLYILGGVSFSMVVISVLIYRQLQLQRQTNQIQAQALRQARRANDAESFSYSVSHDIRTPLLQIRNRIEQLKDLQALSAPIRQELQNIGQTAQEADQLVKKLLYLFNLRQEQLYLSEIEMSTMVNDVYTEEQVLHGYEGCIKIGPLPVVEGDRLLLRQVWQNLLSNGMKYNQLGSLGMIRVSYKREPERHIFFVSDNGVGIPQGGVERIFEPFERLHGRGIDGYGLGLAIVKRIIEKHGGEIWAESLPKGARFGFSLPISQPQI